MSADLAHIECFFRNPGKVMKSTIFEDNYSFFFVDHGSHRYFVLILAEKDSGNQPKMTWNCQYQSFVRIDTTQNGDTVIQIKEYSVEPVLGSLGTKLQ